MEYESVTELVVDTGDIQDDAKQTAAAFSALQSVASDLGQTIREAFAIGGYRDYLKTVRRFGKELTDELLVLQLSFGKMKYAIAEAMAPVAALVVPVINQAIGAITRLAGAVGELFRGLIVGISGQDALAESAQSATAVEEELAQAAVSTGKTVKRSLMSFDQLNRLTGVSGSSTGTGVWEELQIKIPDAISPQIQAIVDKILLTIEPLRKIDLSPLKTALGTLADSFVLFAEQANAGIGWVWKDILMPFVRWVIEELAPVLTNCFAAKLDMVAQAVSPLISGMASLYQALRPVISFIGQQVVGALEHWRNTYESLAAVFREKTPQLNAIFQNLAAVLTAVWLQIKPVVEKLAEMFSGAFQSISGVVTTVVKTVIDSLDGVSTFLSGVFTGNWKTAWDGIKSYFKGVVNGLIGLLNTMLSRFGSAINSVINAANKLSFTIPDWVPLIGGKSYSLNLSTVKIPQLPYLAQGAVLPANKPFMAVVGDQRHGTNIEAPLATIEEAMSGVMQDYLAGSMAGHEATVAVLRQILEAVLGIRIGDDVLAQATHRYEQKMMMVRGV